jgi:hypothetical protein
MDMPQARAPPAPQAAAGAIGGLNVAWSSGVVGAKPPGQAALGFIRRDETAMHPGGGWLAKAFRGQAGLNPSSQSSER